MMAMMTTTTGDDGGGGGGGNNEDNDDDATCEERDDNNDDDNNNDDDDDNDDDGNGNDENLSRFIPLYIEFQYSCIIDREFCVTCERNIGNAAGSSVYVWCILMFLTWLPDQYSICEYVHTCKL